MVALIVFGAGMSGGLAVVTALQSSSLFAGMFTTFFLNLVLYLYVESWSHR